MANELIELQLQGSTTVYKVNDARITTTAITNPTHILCSANAKLTSIAPITTANLASVLGGEMTKHAGGSSGKGGYCLVFIGGDCIAEIYVVDNSNSGYRKYLVMCRMNRDAALYLLAGTEETGRDSSKIDGAHFQINIPSWTQVYYRIILNESNLSISFTNV